RTFTQARAAQRAISRAESVWIEQPRHQDEEAGADEAGDQIAEPAGLHAHAEHAEQPCRHDRADHAEDDVGDQPHGAAGDLLGHPAGNAAHADGRDPADAFLFHGLLPLLLLDVAAAVLGLALAWPGAAALRRRRSELGFDGALDRELAKADTGIEGAHF